MNRCSSDLKHECCQDNVPTVPFCSLMISKRGEERSWSSWVLLSRTEVVWHRLAPGCDGLEPRRGSPRRQQWGKPAGHSGQWKRYQRSGEGNIKNEIMITSAPWPWLIWNFDEWAVHVCNFQWHPDPSLLCKWIGKNHFLMVLSWKYREQMAWCRRFINTLKTLDEFFYVLKSVIWKSPWEACLLGPGKAHLVVVNFSLGRILNTQKSNSIITPHTQDPLSSPTHGQFRRGHFQNEKVTLKLSSEEFWTLTFVNQHFKGWSHLREMPKHWEDGNLLQFIQLDAWQPSLILEPPSFWSLLTETYNWYWLSHLPAVHCQTSIFQRSQWCCLLSLGRKKPLNL